MGDYSQEGIDKESTFVFRVEQILNKEHDVWPVSKKLKDNTNQDQDLHDEVQKALASPEVKTRFANLGADAWTLKPEQFDAYIKDEITSNAKLVKAAGLAP